MLRHVVYLLKGFTIKNISIAVGTIKGYTLCVSDHYYQCHGLNRPWDYDLDSQAAQLLRSQHSCEGKPDIR